MKRNHLAKAICSFLTAGLIALPLSFGAVPAPTANADASSIIGAVVSGISANSQLNAFIKKYNDTEEGRQEFFQEMKKEYGVDNDYAKNQQLDRIMYNLSTAIAQVDPSIKEKPYNYFINNQDTFNAFCTIGHNLSVNRGLYNTLTNEDEIAVVLGHEMGHGQKDHPVKGARRSLNMQVLGAATGSSLGQLAANIINNRHVTKPMEREADALSFDYIIHTNYNPGATAAVWQRVMDLSKTQPSSLQEFLSDHPSDDDRRDAYVKKLKQWSNNHVDDQDGVVSVNGKKFTTPAANGDMSAKERSYFVMGNLAAAYNHGQYKDAATVNGNTVMLGAQPIMTCNSQDESPAVLAERLNKIK